MIRDQNKKSTPTLHLLSFLDQLWNIKVLRTLFPFLVVIGLWQASVEWFNLPEFFYPTPKSTFLALMDSLKKGILVAYIQDSLYRYMLGVAIGVGLGIPLAVLIATNRYLALLLLPITNFFMAIVEMAWIPIFVLWFGYGLTTITVTLAYVVAFPVMFNTIQGVQSIPRSTVDAVRVLGANWYQLLWNVMIPGALPNIVTGIRIGAGYAFRGLIGAEMIAASTGLGFMLFEARQQGLTGRIVVAMIILGLLWLFFDRIYLRSFEKITIERWGMITTVEKE